MQTPTYAKDQFIDDTLLNSAAGLVAADFQQLNVAAWQSGLFFSGALAVSTNGLVATITASLPFQVIFGNGTLASAHGTVVGENTPTATVDFTGVVPSSGTVRVYLLVAGAQVQQNPQPLIGPPPGHPDYNPSFVPGTTYVNTVDTLIFYASTDRPDNNTTFEIARCDLAAAATSLPALDFSWQRGAAVYGGRSLIPFQDSITVNPGVGGATYVAIVTGGDTNSCIATLPPAATNNGAVCRFICATTNTTEVQAQGGDLIYGNAVDPSVGIGLIGLPLGNAIELTSQFGNWQITGGTSTAQGGGAAIPPGTILDYAAGVPPAGYLLCNGQAVSRTNYANLFAIIGTTYGNGDGSTTFNVPDLRGAVCAGLDNMGGVARNVLSNWTTLGYFGGEQSHLLNSNEIPSHTHYFSATTNTENQTHTHNVPATNIVNTSSQNIGSLSGGNTQFAGTQSNYSATGTENQSHNHNVANYTDGGQVGGYSHNNVQPTFGVLKIIKW